MRLDKEMRTLKIMLPPHAGHFSTLHIPIVKY